MRIKFPESAHQMYLCKYMRIDLLEEYQDPKWVQDCKGVGGKV